MKIVLRALAALGLVAAGSATVLTLTSPANADTQICEKFGSTTVGQYIVMNNKWGTDAQQCINVTGSGFSITTQQGVGNTSGAPVSYPAIYYGCHYTNCSPGTVLPKQVNSIRSANSSVGFSFVGGATYDAAYDIWLDPSPKKDGVNQQEIMIWFNRQGSIQPIGSPTGNANIGGRNWQVWTGSNGQNNVVSYLAPGPIDSWSFSILDFINDTKSRTSVNDSWYLTSVQAGFEPWIGGAGLAVNNFSASIDNGTPGPTTPGPTTPGPTTPGPGGPASCRVSYATNVWNSGFVANVTIANTGNSPINGWALGFNLPSGQSITNEWSTELSGRSGSITARNVSYNGNIPASGNTSFGFQGTYSGTFVAPNSFSINGNNCSIG